MSRGTVNVYIVVFLVRCEENIKSYLHEFSRTTFVVFFLLFFFFFFFFKYHMFKNL